MIRRILIFWLSALFLSNGFASPLERASVSYKKHKDYASLEIISQHLDEGMKKPDVENLLGEPDYSPIEGQYYYSSTYDSHPETDLSGERKLPVGAIVDYRNKEGILTDELQQFQMGTIGE